jgi:GAF domain-containing protein
MRPANTERRGRDVRIAQARIGAHGHDRLARDSLAHALRDLTSHAHRNSDITQLLSMLCTHAAAVVGATSCGALLASDRNQLRDVFGSDDQARALALLQVRCVQGPCLDAFDTGDVVVVRDLSDHTARWPEYVVRAQHRDVRGLMAVPIRAGAQVIGALQVMSIAAGTFTDSDALAVEALTTVVADSITRERAMSATRETVHQLQRALESRILIEQAKGVLAERAGLSVSAAFEQLRSYARNNHQQLQEVCKDVIEGNLDHDALCPAALPSAE